MFSYENGKKLVKLGYLINAGYAVLQLIVSLLNLTFLSLVLTLVSLVGLVCCVGGFIFMWAERRDTILLGIPAISVASFVLGFLYGFLLPINPSSIIVPILSLIMALVPLAEYGVWFLLIRNKEKTISLGLLGVCGIAALITVIRLFAPMASFLGILGSLVSIAGMGLCFLAATKLD